MHHTVLFLLGILCGGVLEAAISEQPGSSIGLYTSTIPPRVIMGMAYIPHLAEVSPGEWTYVREHLDGLWVNAAGTGLTDVRYLAENIRSKRYFFIGPVNKAEYNANWKLIDLEFSLKPYGALQDLAEEPCLVLVNDYISKKALDPARYYSDGFIEKALVHVVNDITPGQNPFGNRIYITTRNGHFDKAVYNRSYNPSTTGDLVGRGFSTMQHIANGGGIVYESSPFGLLDHYQEKYIQAFNRARELGADFLWLCPRGHEGTPAEYTAALVEAYRWLEENKLFPDGIVIIHYSRTAAAGEIEYLNMLPMTNEDDPSLPAPGSFTGALYWAIKQREDALEGK